jgi:tetratricopeptide (TPR) repeat protein
MLQRMTATTAMIALLACSGAGDDRPIARNLGDRADATPVRAAMALGYRPDGAAIARAQELARSRSDDPDAYLALARAFVSARRSTGDAAMLAFARDALAAAEELEPGSTAAMAVRGVLLSEEHDFSGLAALAESMIAADPADTTGYLLLGDAHLELGDYADAAAAYDQAMERYPDLRVYARGAYLRWLHGDTEGALELYEDAIQSAGRNREHLAWVLTDLGSMFLNSGAPERARAAAERAEALVPGYPAAAALRARAARIAGDLDDAARELRAALAARASAADQLLLAEVEEARGDRAAAAAARAAGLKLADHDPIPAALYLARRGEQIERAVELAESEAGRRRGVFIQGALALALVRAGRVDRARRALDAAMAIGTPLAELHLADGLVKLAAGDRAGARAARRRAAEINPHAAPDLAAELEKETPSYLPLKGRGIDKEIN